MLEWVAEGVSGEDGRTRRWDSGDCRDLHLCYRASPWSYGPIYEEYRAGDPADVRSKPQERTANRTRDFKMLGRVARCLR